MDTPDDAGTKKFRCGLCGSRFGRVYELKRHEASHRGPPSHVCSICGAAFARRDALARHERSGQGCKANKNRPKKPAIRPGRTLVVAAHSEPRFLLLPLPKNLNKLLGLYTEKCYIHHPILHVPTLLDSFQRVVGTPQERADYGSAGLCPVVAQAILWNATKIAEDEAAMDLWGSACWANLLAWAAHLGLEPSADAGLDEDAVESSPGIVPGLKFEGDRETSVDGSASSDPASSQQKNFTSDDYYRFMRAACIAGNVQFAMGRGSNAARLLTWLIKAHRAGAFGSESQDACTADSKGGWTTERDPENLATWIDAEERARVGVWLAAWDSVAAELQGTKVTLASGGYLLFDGEIRCGELGGGLEAEAVEVLEPGFYGSLPLPCPEDLFEALPSCVDGGAAASWPDHPEFEHLQAWKPIPFSVALEWGDLPYGSPARRKSLNLLYGNFWKNGYTCNRIIVSVMQARLVRYREFCLARGFKLNEPPGGWSTEEAVAREMRDSLVLQFKDAWDAWPVEIKEAEDLADGEALRRMAADAWGARLAPSIYPLLACMRGIGITLNSPRDFVADLMALASQAAPGSALGVNEDVLDGILDWTTSPLFVVASSHAIAISKIARSVLAVQSDPVTGFGRALSPLWPIRVLRAAWLHVLCILKFQRVAQSMLQDTGDMDPTWNLLAPTLSPEYLGALLDDVDACLKSIDGMVTATPVNSNVVRKRKPRMDPWRYSLLVHGIMRKLLGVDFSNGSVGTLELNEDQVAMLSMLKDLQH